MQPAATTKHLTLLLLSGSEVGCHRRVLLGLKKRGFGAGKWNGFGGKVEPGETLLEAAVREMVEESGLTPLDARHVGSLDFTFEGVGETLRVYVFTASAWTGEVTESEEMRPQWWSVSDLPYESMWADDAHWLPLALAGRAFNGRFAFRGHSEIVSFELSEVDAQAAWLEGAYLVTEAQGAITA